jgi:hypothetical protein
VFLAASTAGRVGDRPRIALSHSTLRRHPQRRLRCRAD